MEAIVICIDNSEWSRNGDFQPTRLQAQKESANMIATNKINQGQENTVAILTMAADRAEIRATATNNLGVIMTALSDIKVSSKCDFVRGIQIAQLSLKHRINKSQKQRIICFFGSPVVESIQVLEELGKQLKKNSVSLDIVSFGSVEENSPKLHKLYESVNNNNTSHIVECLSKDGLLSDIILSSEIACDRDAPLRQDSNIESGNAPFGASAANEFGVDPNTDPDLYMALRLSLEEENSRMQRQMEQLSKTSEDTLSFPQSGENRESMQTIMTAEALENVENSIKSIEPVVTDGTLEMEVTDVDVLQDSETKHEEDDTVDGNSTNQV